MFNDIPFKDTTDSRSFDDVIHAVRLVHVTLNVRTKRYIQLSAGYVIVKVTTLLTLRMYGCKVQT